MRNVKDWRLSFSYIMKTYFQGGTSDLVLYVACFGVSFCVVSPSMCLDGVKLDLGSGAATFW